jgi:hypothetical protein
MSFVNVATSSVTGVSWHNMSMTGGFTPRRTFNTASVTLSQLAEVVATICNDIFKK